MATSKHLKQVKHQLYLKLISAYRGWWQWHKIIKGKGVEGETAVILLPDCNRETNHLALLYLDDMLKPLFSQNILRVISFNRKKAEHLMQFYCLYEFDKRFTVASLDEPNGRNGSKLIGKRGTTVEEIFVIGVYQVYPFQRPHPPAYSGNDPEIITFLKGESP